MDPWLENGSKPGSHMEIRSVLALTSELSLMNSLPAAASSYSCVPFLPTTHYSHPPLSSFVFFVRSDHTPSGLLQVLTFVLYHSIAISLAFCILIAISFSYPRPSFVGCEDSSLIAAIPRTTLLFHSSFTCPPCASHSPRQHYIVPGPQSPWLFPPRMMDYTTS